MDGNRKCEAEGLPSKVFSPGWTSITVNKIELELCVKEEIWIRMGNSDDEYISIKELITIFDGGVCYGIRRIYKYK